MLFGWPSSFFKRSTISCTSNSMITAGSFRDIHSRIPSLEAHNSIATLAVSSIALAQHLTHSPLSFQINPPLPASLGLPRDEPFKLSLNQFKGGLIQLTLILVHVRACFLLMPMNANSGAFQRTSSFKFLWGLSFRNMTLFLQSHKDQIPKENIIPQLMSEEDNTLELQQFNLSDVEQIARAFLEQQGHQKSQRKIKVEFSRGHRSNSIGIA